MCDLTLQLYFILLFTGVFSSFIAYMLVYFAVTFYEQKKQKEISFKIEMLDRVGAIPHE